MRLDDPREWRARNKRPALALLLLSLGVGLGLTIVSPWGGGPSPTTFKTSAGIYFIVVAMIAEAASGGILDVTVEMQ